MTAGARSAGDRRGGPYAAGLGRAWAPLPAAMAAAALRGARGRGGPRAPAAALEPWRRVRRAFVCVPGTVPAGVL